MTSEADLRHELEELRARLEEAEETLRAIRHGEVDALAVGDQVYTLQTAETPYRTLVETMSEGAATLATDGTVLYANSSLAALVGVPLHRLLGSSLRQFALPDDCPMFDSLLLSGAAGPVKAELALTGAEGQQIPVLFSCNPIDLDAAQGVCVVVTDLTEQRRNAAIVASEQLARSILDQAAEAIVVCDPAGAIIRASRATQELAGRPVLFEPFEEVFALEADDPPWPEGSGILAHVLSGGLVRAADTGLLRVAADGALTRVSLLASAAPLRDEDGRIVGAVFTLADATVQQQQAAALRALNEQLEQRVLERTAALARQAGVLQTVLNSVAEAVVMVDAAGDLLVYNPAAERLLGPRPERLGRRASDRTLCPDALLPLLQHALAGQEVAGDEQLLWHEQERRELWIAVSARAVHGAQGGVVGAVAVAQDVTQRRQGEHAQRLESLGRLAGGVAHEVNNLLQCIVNSSFDILDQLPQAESADAATIADVREGCEEIHETAMRGGELAGQLLSFSRRRQPERALLDLREVVQRCDRLISRLLGRDITLRLDLAEGSPPVLADEGQVQQVLLNLAANARDAMPGGGTVRLSLDAVAAGQPGLPPAVSHGCWVRLTMADTGCGIAPDIRSLIFEPFFTTKGPHEGTGLGLSTVYAIVRDNDGVVDVASREGEGATFTIYLPAADDAEAADGGA